MNTNASVRNERDIYVQYLNDISKYPLLSREQEVLLLKKIRQGNRAAMDLLVKSNLRFVVNIANLYRGQGLDVGELISEGNMGLMEAARRFDPDQKIKFISYAVWWVRQNITRAIAEKGRMVRISAEKELVLRRFNKKGGKLRQVVGGSYVLDPESLAGVSKYKAEAIEKILQMGSRTSSLDAPVGEDGESTLGDCLAAENASTDTLAEVNDRSRVFGKVLNENLSSQEEDILKLYFGFKMDSDLNLKEIAPMVGLSKERVRQLKESALAKLRNDQIERLLYEAA
jgi:RNA polymerase primary sigma factor